MTPVGPKSVAGPHAGSLGTGPGEGTQSWPHPAPAGSAARQAQGLSELVRVRLCAGCKIDDREAREVKPVDFDRVLPVKVIAKKLST